MSLHLQSNEIEIMDEIQDGLAYTIGESNISLRQLMTNGFIAEHSEFLNWHNFLDSAGITSEKDFEKPEINEFINRHTDFENWEEMLVQAANEFTKLKEKELNSVL